MRGASGAAASGAFEPVFEDTRVAGTPNFATESMWRIPPTVSSIAAPARLGEPATGFPQSTQNFEAGSFAQPQNAQLIKAIRGSGRGCANIRPPRV